MDILINGAGAFVSIAALPMLAGLLLREGLTAHRLRRLSIILAVLLPLIFMLLAAVLYISKHNGSTFFDFSVNYRAAIALYDQGHNPYRVAGAFSFPFPSFYFYWLASGFGRLDETTTWVVWWIVNALIWLGCALALGQTLPPATSRREQDLRHYVMVTIPAVATLWQGQTALLILAGLVLLHVATQADRGMRWQIGGGIGLAVAALIKPQLALVGVGIALWGALALRAALSDTIRPERFDAVRRIVIIIGTAVLTVAVLIGLTLILPGGVTADTYRDFLQSTLSQVARPADHLVIGSLSYLMGTLVYRLGGTDRLIDLASNIGTALVLLLAVLWTVRRASRPPMEIAAGWGVWAMVAPRVAWTWYAAWCLPFFVLLVVDLFRRNRSRWAFGVVLLLMVLDAQAQSLLVAGVTILLICILTWTAFSPAPNPA